MNRIGAVGANLEVKPGIAIHLCNLEKAPRMLNGTHKTVLPRSKQLRPGRHGCRVSCTPISARVIAVLLYIFLRL